MKLKLGKKRGKRMTLNQLKVGNSAVITTVGGDGALRCRLLDMGLMNLSTPTLPKFTLEIPDASKDYSRIFQLNPNVTYSQGLSNIFSLSNSRYFSSNPFGLTGFWGSTDNLQMGSFTLKNGMRIHTYGEYDKDGWKVPNPSALPWEKNNFKGAFELKSANGAFGIRIEVQQGRHVPY